MSTLLYAASVSLVFFFIRLYNQRNRRSFPPGPPGIPFIGNLLDMTKSQRWRGIDEWREKYGKNRPHNLTS